MPNEYSTSALYLSPANPGSSLKSALGMAPNAPTTIVLRNIGSGPTRAKATWQQSLTKISVSDVEIASDGIAVISQPREVLSTSDAEWIVKIEHDGRPGTLIGRAFTVDRTAGSVLYNSFEPAGYSRYNGVYWRVSSDASTALTISNLAPIDDTVTVTLFSSDRPITLPHFKLKAGESRSVTLNTFLSDREFSSGGFTVAATSADSRILVKEQFAFANGRVVSPLYGAPPYVTGFHADPNSVSLVESDSTGFNCYIDYSDSSSYSHSCGSPSSSAAAVAYATISGSSGTVSSGQPGTATITLDSSYTDGNGIRQPLQGQIAAVVCGFTISPGQFNSNYCTATPPGLQQKSFSANVSPSLGQCVVSTSLSTCAAGSPTSGDITMDVTPYSCNITTFNVNGTARFYGPSTSTGSNSLTIGFTLRLNGRNLTKSSSIPVVCP